MKKIIHGLILLFLSSHWGVMASSNQIEVQELEIKSSVLNETRKLVIYLPEGYGNNEKSYPTLYLTDGKVQGAHTAGTLDYLSKFEQTPQMIVVGIVTPGTTRQRDLTVTSSEKYVPNQLQNADRFLSFIEKEVIPFVKSKYRTLDYQALSGTSHGGQFAINALLKKPKLFNGIIAISPSLYWNNNQLIGLAENALKQGELQGQLYLSIANEESTMTQPYEKLVQLTERYPSEQLTVASQTFSNETHNTTVLQGQYYGLKHLFDGWALPEGVQLTLSDLQAIYNRRSEMLNTPFVIPQDRANGFGQWLLFTDNRQDDALELLKWNTETYTQSLEAHTVLIKAYLYFKMNDEAKAALEKALSTLKDLNAEQKAELKRLLS